MRAIVMKKYVVIGFDIRKHIVTGKVFEDIEEANEYLLFLYAKIIGKIIGKENHLLEYADIFEMDYVPKK
jgi:hypothetical protein